jgi:hypothetical protein
VGSADVRGSAGASPGNFASGRFVLFWLQLEALADLTRIRGAPPPVQSADPSCDALASAGLRTIAG